MTDVSTRDPFVCLSVSMPSVTLMHPAKSVGQNEMPFGRDTRGPLGPWSPTGRGYLGVGTGRSVAKRNRPTDRRDAPQIRLAIRQH